MELFNRFVQDFFGTPKVDESRMGTEMRKISPGHSQTDRSETPSSSFVNTRLSGLSVRTDEARVIKEHLLKSPNRIEQDPKPALAKLKAGAQEYESLAFWGRVHDRTFGPNHYKAYKDFYDLTAPLYVQNEAGSVASKLIQEHPNSSIKSFFKFLNRNQDVVDDNHEFTPDKRNQLANSKFNLDSINSTLEKWINGK